MYFPSFTKAINMDHWWIYHAQHVPICLPVALKVSFSRILHLLPLLEPLKPPRLERSLKVAVAAAAAVASDFR